MYRGLPYNRIMARSSQPRTRHVFKQRTAEIRAPMTGTESRCASRSNLPCRFACYPASSASLSRPVGQVITTPTMDMGPPAPCLSHLSKDRRPPATDFSHLFPSSALLPPTSLFACTFRQAGPDKAYCLSLLSLFVHNLRFQQRDCPTRRSPTLFLAVASAHTFTISLLYCRSPDYVSCIEEITCTTHSDHLRFTLTGI